MARAPLHKLPIRRGPVNLARQALLRLADAGLTTAYGAYRVHPAVWRLTAGHYHPALERFAELNAWMFCPHAPRACRPEPR